MNNVEMVKELGLGICELRKGELDMIFNVTECEKTFVDAGLVKSEDFIKFCDAIEVVIHYLRIETVTLFNKEE